MPLSYTQLVECAKIETWAGNSSGWLWKSSRDGVFFIMRLSDAETGEEWEIGAGERCSFKSS